MDLIFISLKNDFGFNLTFNVKRTNSFITNIHAPMKIFMLRVKDFPCFNNKIVKICHKD